MGKVDLNTSNENREMMELKLKQQLYRKQWVVATIRFLKND